jgi:hypothetical protein
VDPRKAEQDFQDGYSGSYKHKKPKRISHYDLLRAVEEGDYDELYEEWED